MAFDSLGSSLLGSINSFAGIASNTPTGLDTPLPFGTGVQSFGALGAFATNIDRSAQRQYIETGLVRNIRPRNMEVLLQEPDITILVKKRQFSSLSENYRNDLMDANEKLFVRATKRLFYNKCRAVAAYEKLTKIERIAVNNGGIISDTALPMVFSAADSLNSLAPGIISSQTQSIIDTIRRIKIFSDPNAFTTWIVDPTVPYSPDLGEGTGVFELTNVQSISCTNTLKFIGGSADINIEDPYKLMLISNDDIDRAIIDANNFFVQNAGLALTRSTLEQTIADLRSTLTTLRFSRGVSDILFLINENTLLYKKVRAIIDEEGREINFTFDGGFLGIGSSASLDASATQGPNGLQGEEVTIFQQIIQNIYTMLGLEQTSKLETLQFNTSTNYVRKRMRLEFGNKPIIQPMDIVHVFISTKTIEDSMLTQGLNISFAANSLLNQINNTIGNIQNSLTDLASAFSGGSNSSFIEQERDAIAGPSFPLWLWLLLRNDFTRQSAGTHVFAGIVEGSTHSYQNGKYDLKVSVKDNSKYFDLSWINFNPSVDVFNGSLYDPLTPFNVQFDPSSGLIRGEFPLLLDENIRLLGSKSVKSKSGRFRGSILDTNSYQILDAEKMPAASIFRRKLNDPDGFAYRWKQGIGSIVLFGEPHNSDNFNRERSPSLTKNPFAGQDVMNVLSLLITAQPYNFNNFVKAAVMSGNLSRDDLFNISGSASYFRGLVNDLNISNGVWGNFVPFKRLVINESGYRFLQSGEFDVTTANKRTTDLLRERAKRFDELVSIFPQFANNPQFYKTGISGSITVDPTTAQAIDLGTITTLASDIINLDVQVQQQNTVFLQSLQNANIRSTDGTLRIFGDDISFDPTITQTSSLTPDQTVKEREDFRKTLSYLTQRRLWKVKANKDTNLFIVDDSYDKNYDIQAFEQSLVGNLSTFASTYSKVSDHIQATADLLGLEVFADSQGHIQVRPPQYNRMPTSVFYDMIINKQTSGIQIFPEYLESLFINQIDGLVNQLEIIEDQIRIRAAALGYITDSAAQTLLRGAVSGIGALSDVTFKFVTDETTGLVGGTDFRAIFFQSAPDAIEANLTAALNILNTTLNVPLNQTAVNFDVIQRTTVVNSTTGFGGVSSDVGSAIARIGTRIEQKTGQPAPTKQTLLSHDSVISGRSQLDVLDLTQQISQFLSERQKVIKLLGNAVKNLNQGTALNNDPNVTRSILFPSLTQVSSDLFPEIMQHMLEDENYDDLGLGSSKRYIIKDSNIISFNIQENPPPWTSVEVNGELQGGLVPGPSGLEVGSGGNGISSASAVDYDMWRLYGFRGTNTAHVWMLSDSSAQCAPYAVFLLNRARKDILKGSVTCVGNEFLQAGEVYYIEDYDLLFYADSVTHNFTYGQQYITSMNLTYGHNPGEYIPTMLDIIGKGLYTNGNNSNLLRHDRHRNGNNETPLAILVKDASITSSGLEQLLAGAYGDLNKNNLVKISQAASGLLAPTLYGDQVSLEFRIYYNSSAGFSSADSSLVSLANGALNWLKNPTKQTQTIGGGSANPDNTVDPSINLKNVSVVQVDISKLTETRSSPSAQAWSIGRNIALTGSTPIVVTPVGDPSAANQTQLAQQEMKSLFSNVIDVWATFTPPTTGVTQTTNSLDPPLNQNDLNQANQYLSNFKKSLGVK